MLQSILSQVSDNLVVLFLITWMFSTIFGLTSDRLILELKEIKPSVIVIVVPSIIFIVVLSIVFYWKSSTLFLENNFHIFSSFWYIVLLWVAYLILNILFTLVNAYTNGNPRSFKFYLLGIANWFLYAIFTVASMITFVDALTYFREWV